MTCIRRVGPANLPGNVGDAGDIDELGGVLAGRSAKAGDSTGINRCSPARIRQGESATAAHKGDIGCSQRAWRISTCGQLTTLAQTSLFKIRRTSEMHTSLTTQRPRRYGASRSVRGSSLSAVRRRATAIFASRNGPPGPGCQEFGQVSDLRQCQSGSGLTGRG